MPVRCHGPGKPFLGLLFFFSSFLFFFLGHTRSSFWASFPKSAKPMPAGALVPVFLLVPKAAHTHQHAEDEG
ncbi:hypothetical protein BRADI_2g11282v3 [Brachypodium distachyon]|uniref:Uncharacterized protein n=1 Tax=Brachypodium distachyon TaxID=15368 RepID=A0A2K2D801_BRADI|nr:hypothetical protein BRADI_2g11282v3 [Brachypodium distachyon]